MQPAFEHRPWGRFIVLEDRPDHKVKRIYVEPGQRLSYQKHHRRAETWVLIIGEALVTLGNTHYPLSAGEVIHIPVDTWHRVENIGDICLIFVEVQTGTYFGEDDIERKEDDYGRVD